MSRAHERSGQNGERLSRSRSWIVTAFNRLVLGRRYESVSVGEVARRAGVGRSTFYEHFRDKDDVLRQALGPVLMPLASAAVGRGDAASVRASLEHVAEQRVRAVAMLDGPARGQVEQALADLIAAQLERAAPSVPPAMRALESARLAGAQVAMIRAWLKGGGAGAAAGEVAQLIVERGLEARENSAAASRGGT